MSPASRPSDRPPPGRRRDFTTSWWGAAWLDALEHGALSDPNRLPRGRTYARHGAVGPLQLQRGLVLADVRGSRPRPYSVLLRVATWDDERWDAALDVVAGTAAHAAALADGELSAQAAGDLAAAGLALLPGPGDLELSCSCPDRAVPCKHIAAVCYVVASTLDADPFTVLLLRGRTRTEVLAELRRRRSPTPRARPPAGTSATEPSATERWQAWEARQARSLARTEHLPREDPPHRSPRLGRRPGEPTPLEPAPPTSGVDAAALDLLARDAAERAWHLLTRSPAPVDAAAGLDAAEGLDAARPDVVVDTARWAAALAGTEAFDRLARQLGVGRATLAARAVSWRNGGAGGVAAVSEPWRAPAGALDPGRAALAAAAGCSPAAIPAAGARCGPGPDGVALHLGRDGRWYRVEDRGRGPEVVRPPASDPAELVEGPDPVDPVGPRECPSA